MKSNESNLQSRGVDWLRMTLPHVLVIAIPNEWAAAVPKELPNSEQRRMGRIQKLKSMGMYAGAADLLIAWSDNGLQTGMLETKDKAPQSSSQVKFEKAWLAIGGRYAIWRSLEQLQSICESWGLKPYANVPQHTPTSRKQLQQSLYHQFMLDISKNNI